MTEKERDELGKTGLGFFIKSMIDNDISLEEIKNAETYGTLGVGLRELAISYRQLAGDNLLLDELQNELAKKASKNELDEAVSDKASTSYVDGEVADLNTAIRDKASTTYVDGKVADLNTAISDKASTSYVDSKVSNVDTELRINFNSELAKKASKTELNTAVSDKASTTYVDVEVDNLNTAISKKASLNDVATAISGKANTSDITSLSTQIDGLTTQINDKAATREWNDVQITVGDWSSTAPYSQNVPLTGMSAQYKPFIGLSLTNISTSQYDIQEGYYNCVKDVTAADGSITLICPKQKPAGTFSINVKVVY